MAIKDNKTLKKVKKVVAIGAAIGGSALAGAALKKVDTSTIKGISKICIPLGVFGLAHCAGQFASTGAENQVDDICDIADKVIEFTEKLDVDYPDDEEGPHLEVVTE